MYEITIFTEMTTGHGFTDVFYCNEFDNSFIEDLIFQKAERRGFKKEEIFKYKATVEPSF